MEVPARLSDLLTEGQTLIIRGDGDDSAVVCSSTMVSIFFDKIEVTDIFVIVL